MQLLYNIFIRTYYFGILLVSPFNKKAKKWIAGRKKSVEALEKFAAENPKNIWVHCASVGEYEQGLPLIQKLENQYPTYTILVSFFSPSGYEYAAKKHPSQHIVYLQLDTNYNSNRWIKTLNPKLAIFVKYEFWHYYFHAIKAANIPLLMVSAIFWKELFFFKNYAGFFRKSLRQVTHFFVQDEESKKLLQEIGVPQITVSGDTRFERVLALKNTPFPDAKIEQFKSDNKLIVFGSVWQHDVAVIKKIISTAPKEYKFIIAPHEIQHFPYESFSNFNTTKYTSSVVDDSAKILFLDTLGLLSRVYRFANAAYVGGGFSKGIHNILEPAVYNIPIFTGPNMQRFMEAKKLQELGVLQVLNSKEKRVNTQPLKLELSKNELRLNTDYFNQNSNATEEILVFIKKHGILD